MTIDATDTEKRLILELKDQSRDMEALVRQHFPMVYATCLQITRNRHDAEDATQAVFLCLAVQLNENREIRSLGPWLHQVACRASIDLCRRRKRRELHESAAAGIVDDTTPDTASSDAAMQELRPLLLACLNDLPAKYRLPLILHYFGGLSHADLARELACTRPTLRVRMHRGHRMLRNALKRHGIGLSGAALVAALSAAVQWQVSQTLVGSTAGALHAAGYGITATSAMATGVMPTRIINIKLAIAISAAVAACLAAGAPLLAKLREWQDFPLIPSVQDLAPVIERVFTAPLPRLVHASPANPSDSSVARSRPPAAPWTGAYALASNRSMPGGVLQVPDAGMPVPSQAAAPQTAIPAGVQTPSSAPGSPAATFQLPSTSTPNSAGKFVSSHRPRSSGGVALAPGGDSHANPKPELVIRIDPGDESPWDTVTPTTTGQPVWSNSLAVARQPTPFSSLKQQANESPAYDNISAAIGATLEPPAEPLQSPRILDNNGQIVAVARAVSYDDYDVIRNSIENTGPNGWFASRGGEIDLPPIRLTEGEQWRNWGESDDDESIDLINSVRLGLTSSAIGQLDLSLLAPDHIDVPTLPPGHHFVGVWKMEGGEAIIGSISVTVRYDDMLLAAKGLDEQYIKLWVHDDVRWMRVTQDFARDTELNHVRGTIPLVEFFAVSTPEPSAAAFVLLAGGGVLLRRSRRK